MNEIDKAITWGKEYIEAGTYKVDYNKAAVQTLIKLAEEKQQREQGCVFTGEEDPGGTTIWECFRCNSLHVFGSGGPEENEYKYCSYCGTPIKEIKEA